MHDILNKLVEHKYLISFEIENNTLIVRYELSSVKDTTRAIDITNKTLSKAFQDSGDELAVDILSCLVNKNDFYGYSNKKELNQRIKEETDYLTYLAELITVYEKEYEK